MPAPARKLLEVEAAFIRSAERDLPRHDRFNVNLDLLRSDRLLGENLCYCFFEGRARSGPGALLAVSLGLEGLQTRRWPVETANAPARVESLLGLAFAIASEQIGRTAENNARLRALLLQFRIDRHPKTYARDRVPPASLTSGQRRAAEALGLALAHILDPQPLPGVRGFRCPPNEQTLALPADAVANSLNFDLFDTTARRAA